MAGDFQQEFLAEFVSEEFAFLAIRQGTSSHCSRMAVLTLPRLQGLPDSGALDVSVNGGTGGIALYHAPGIVPGVAAWTGCVSGGIGFMFSHFPSGLHRLEMFSICGLGLMLLTSRRASR